MGRSPVLRHGLWGGVQLADAGVLLAVCLVLLVVGAVVFDRRDLACGHLRSDTSVVVAHLAWAMYGCVASTKASTASRSPPAAAILLTSRGSRVGGSISEASLGPPRTHVIPCRRLRRS
jgi:hypothetical protein